MNKSQDYKITESFLFVAGYSEKQESQSMYIWSDGAHISHAKISTLLKSNHLHCFWIL